MGWGPADTHRIEIDNIAHFEGEVLGLAGTSLMYDGVRNGFHWYHEVE